MHVEGVNKGRILALREKWGGLGLSVSENSTRGGVGGRRWLLAPEELEKNVDAVARPCFNARNK